MTESSNRPLGKLFSEVYREKGVPVSDNKKFRVQLSGFFSQVFHYRVHYSLYTYLKTQAGIEVPYLSGYETVYRFEEFILGCPVDELLDCITHFARFANRMDEPKAKERWISQVQFAFDTQNISYAMDDEGGVHHRIDAAYKHSKTLTLTCLSASNFAAAHEEIEKAFDFLTQRPPDNKMAVVNAFLAAENVFKITIGAKNGLTKAEAMTSLTPLVQKIYAEQGEATRQATGRLVSSFASWADACHPYRHGQHDEKVIAPPDEVAITLVTVAADYIRWLVELSKYRN